MKTPCARNVSSDTADDLQDRFLRVPGLSGSGVTQFDHPDDAHWIAGAELLAGRKAIVVERGGKFYVQLEAVAMAAELTWRSRAPRLPGVVVPPLSP